MSEPMSEERLKEIAAREKAATPGPWWTERDHHGQENLYAPDGFWLGRMPHQCVVAIEQQQIANAAFVVEARADIPDLLAEVRRLREALALNETRRTNLLASCEARGVAMERAEAERDAALALLRLDAALATVGR